VLNRLTSLVEKSLIQRIDVAHGGVRIALLETIREFATDRFAQNPNLAARARRAHASYYADLVHRLQPNMTGNQRLEVLAAMAADIDNLHLAWTYWVNAEALQQLEKMADALLMLNETRGWYSATVGLTTDMLAVLERCSPSQVDQEIGLRTTLARALMATRGYTPEVEDAFARSIELFDRGGDVHQHFSALRGQACLLSMRGNLRDGMRMGLELQRFAERENDPAMLIEGNLRLGVLKTMVNDPQGGLDHLDRAISLFPAVPRHAFTTRAGGNDPRVACYTTAALALWLLGYPDQAVARANAALTLAKELDYPFTQANAYFHSGLLHLWRRDFDIVLTRAVDLQSIAGRHGFQIWTATATILSGAAQVGLGSSEEGLVNLQSGMDLYQGMHSPPVFWPMLLSIQATACLDAGRPGEGLRLIEPALNIMSAGAGATLLCELQLLKGDLLAAVAAEHGRNDPEADQWHQRAFDRAREMNLRTTQLRAAMRLCRAARDNAGQNAAITSLAEIHATFTEGWTTHDLIEARALLAASAASSAHV
ncbi:MAG: hypothetical protein L0H19_04900, partial [Salinisphaera sp.]|nr:hypothetical protein [Salinisphaera sp.]